MTTPEKAVEDIQDGATIIPGMVNADKTGRYRITDAGRQRSEEVGP